MKYCSKCGNEVAEEAIICPKCGCFIDSQNNTYSAEKKQGNTTLQTVAKVFMLLALVSILFSSIMLFCMSAVYKNMDEETWNQMFEDTVEFEINGDFDQGMQLLSAMMSVFGFLCLIPFAYAIPMTVHYFKATKAGNPVGTAFKICVLLFIGIVPGILMLCDN